MKSKQSISMRIHLVTDDGVDVGTGIVDMPITLTHPKVVKAGEVVQVEVQVEVSVDVPPTLVEYSIDGDKRALASRPTVAEDRDGRRLTEHKTTTTDRDRAVES